MLRLMFFTVSCCALVTSATAAPPSFTVLGDLPGGEDASYANAVSADGSVVVGWSWSYEGQQSFRWTRNSGLDAFGPNAMRTPNQAMDVSADGAFIAGSIGGERPAAFRWDSENGLLQEIIVGGRAFGIPDDGRAVVGDFYSRSGAGAFYWSSDEGVVVLPPYTPTNTNQSAQGVSGDGSLVVGFTSVASEKVPMRWSAAADFEILKGPAGETIPAEALAASFDGSVVVGALEDGSAFRWTQATGIQSLLEGATNEIVSAAARDVSADGSMVVGGSEEYGAFMWDDAHGARSLRDVLIERYDLADELGDFQPLIATGVSADGRTIVGAGDFGGVTRGFVATVPEPGTTGIALASATAIIATMRRRACAAFRSLLPLLCCFALVSTSQGAKPSFTEIGKVHPFDLSAGGEVVVGGISRFGYQAAFRWSSNTGIEELPLLEPSTRLEAWSVSGDGSFIAGTVEVDNSASFTWSPELGTQSFALLRPRDMSADGSVVIGDNSGVPVRWTEATGMEPLWSSAERGGIAMAISADKTTIVGSRENQPFRWTQETARQDLGFPKNDGSAFTAVDVSADGSVLLIAEPGRAGGPSRFWTEATGFRLITTDADFRAVAMSNNARIVAGTTQGVGAAIWTESLGVMSVEQLLIDIGLTEDIQGWNLQNALLTSAKGDVLVGMGTNSSGERVAWRATVPEPSTGALGVLLTLAAIAFVSHRRQATA